MPARSLLAAAAAAAIALPALAQDTTPQASSAAPATGSPAAATPRTAAPTPTTRSEGLGESETGLVEFSPTEAELEPPPPPIEYPDHARRDPRMVGRLNPVELGLGANPWRGASGAFLASLMRRMDTPLASRWAHISLRNALLSRSLAPRNVDPVDWAAERAWLLLRMGEADAGRMIVAGVDVDRFTPRMYQVGVQSALANADPAGLCPLQDGIQKTDPNIVQLVDAMCAALAGEPETASAQVDSARRRGRMRGIDLELAQKVVGAGSNTGTRGDHRMGRRRPARHLAVRPRDRHRADVPRPSDQGRAAAAAGMAGGRADPFAAGPACIRTDRDRARGLLVAVDGRPAFDDLRFDRPGRHSRDRRPGSFGWRSSARTRKRGSPPCASCGERRRIISRSKRRARCSGVPR